MPISSDNVSIYIVEETVVGTTPDPAVWEPLPIVSESIATNATTTVSNSLNPQRQVVDSVLTGMDVSGSLECELGRSPAMDLLLESGFASTWVDTLGDWKLSVESTKKTFSLMKKIDDTAGGFKYQIYKGCTVNTMATTMTAGAEVTMSIGIVGETADADRSTVEPPNSSYNTLSTFNVLRAPEVKNIVLDNEGGTLAPELTGVCVTDLTLNLNANVRGIQCLGTLGNKSVVLGRFEASLDMQIFFTDNNIMEEFLNQNILDVTFDIGDVTGFEFYQYVMTRCKISSETTVATGTGTDFYNALTLQALVDTSLSPQTSIVCNTKAYS